MALEITIKDIPEDVYAGLSEKAALQQKSLDAYLLEELRRIAQPLANKEWVEEVRKLRETQSTKVTAEEIIRARDADRK